MKCENCAGAIEGAGIGHGRFCSTRCYHAAWMRTRRQKDLSVYREEMRQRRSDPEFMERQRESNRRSRERYREQVNARSLAWSKANAQKVSAQRAARDAIERGELEREGCLFCDDEHTHAHHHDYTQPLAVTFLCVQHHGLAHRKAA